MPKLSELNPSDITVVSAPDGQTPMKLSQMKPDDYQVITSAPPPGQSSTGDALLRGAAQGSTLGFADEMTGAAGGLYDYIQGKLGNRGDISLSDAYHTRRDSARKADAKAEAEHPYATLAGQALGGIGTAVVPGLSALNVGKGAGLVEAAAKGAALGGIVGAGNAKEITDVPSGVLSGAATGAAIGGGLNRLGRGVSAAASKAGPLLAKVLGGVDSETLAKYAANADRINQAGALPEEAVKDAIDSGVGRAVGDKEALAERAAALEELMNHAYEQKQAQLAGSATPLAKAKEISASLAGEKDVLHEMSQRADQALEKSGVTFQKKDLLKAIDDVGFGAGDAIGDETTEALSKLQTTRDRLQTQLPDEIPATRLRKALQQIRKDINFDQKSGEFNDELSKMRKVFTGQISNALKTSVPEYAEIMDSMADRSNNLSRMNRHFGDPDKALSSLEALRKGTVRSQLVEDALQNHAVITDDSALAQNLAELKNSQSILGRIQNGEDLRREFFPKQWGMLQEAKNDAQMAADVAAPVERLGQNRTQAIIRNQGGKIANIEDRRALEALSKMDGGQNYPQMIEDKNVFDAFKKGQEKSGRLTMMGGALGTAAGSLIGHPVQGGIIGAQIGGALNVYGPAIVKGTVDSAQALRKVLNNSEAVQRLGPYAQTLLDAASKGNTALAAINQKLLASDPVYRNLFPRDPNDSKRDAIQRRLSH